MILLFADWLKDVRKLSNACKLSRWIPRVMSVKLFFYKNSNDGVFNFIPSHSATLEVDDFISALPYGRKAFLLFSFYIDIKSSF